MRKNFIISLVLAWSFIGPKAMALKSGRIAGPLTYYVHLRGLTVGPGDYPLYTYGAGFIVSHNTILTAGHVVYDHGRTVSTAIVYRTNKAPVRCEKVEITTDHSHTEYFDLDPHERYMRHRDLGMVVCPNNSFSKEEIIPVAARSTEVWNRNVTLLGWLKPSGPYVEGTWFRQILFGTLTALRAKYRNGAPASDIIAVADSSLVLESNDSGSPLLFENKQRRSVVVGVAASADPVSINGIYLSAFINLNSRESLYWLQQASRRLGGYVTFDQE